MERGTILITDDDRSIRVTLVAALENLDYEIEPASSAEEALSRLRASPQSYVLLLVDLRMPGMQGIELLHVLAEEYPEIPVLVISAFGTVETVIEAMEAGALGFIEKPFTPERIRSAVSYALDRERREEEIGEKYDEHLRAAARHLVSRHLDSALEHAKLALAVDATRPEAFNMVGVIKQAQSDVRAAQRFYMAALALDSGFRPAQLNQENLARPPSRRRPGIYKVESDE